MSYRPFIFLLIAIIACLAASPAQAAQEYGVLVIPFAFIILFFVVLGVLLAVALISEKKENAGAGDGISTKSAKPQRGKRAIIIICCLAAGVITGALFAAVRFLLQP